MTEKILCVDDEPNILLAYQRTFRKQYVLDVASSGAEGLERLAAEGPYAVVVADMHMPEMDGVRFLARVREVSPDTVRMMLTGNSSLLTAIEAVNEGHIFRFLTKPCPADTLSRALEAGVAQYRLLTAEHDLLERTLKGAVKVLTDVLAMANPLAFGRGSRVRRLVLRIADQLPAETGRWELEVAAMLSPIGCVVLPEDKLEKLFRGKPLGPTEAKLLAEHARIGHGLIAGVPRLESVATMIAYQDRRYDGAGAPPDDPRGESIPLGARILKAALDFDTILAGGVPAPQALTTLLGRPGWYDPIVLDALATALQVEARWTVKEVDVEKLAPGMVVAEDVRSISGLLLLAKGQEVTSSLRLRLQNVAAFRDLRQTLKVAIPLELQEALP